MTRLQEASKALQDKYKEVSHKYLWYIPIVCVALLAAFFNVWLCVAALLFSFGYQLIYLRKKRGEFSDVFNHYHILLGLEPHLEQVQHELNAGIDRDTLRHARLMPIGEVEKQTLLKQLTTGTCRELPISICDASICYTYLFNNIKRADCATGCWINIPLPCDTGCDWRLLDKGALKELARRSYFSGLKDQEKFELGIEWFDKKYYFYRPVGTNQCPNAAFLKQLKMLSEYTPGRVCVSLCGDQLNIFIQGRVMARNVTLSRSITIQQVSSNPLPELEYLVRMAHVLCGKAQPETPVERKEEPQAGSENAPESTGEPAETGTES